MKKSLIILICFLVSACTVQKELLPINGSKAGGTILMGYEIGEFEKANVDFDRAKDLATKKCEIWGYKGAEPFGGQISYCSNYGILGRCLSTQVLVQYQCLDSDMYED